MKKLIVNSAVCSGCRACTMACSGEHYEMFCGELARIRIVKLEDKGIDVPITCRQCSNAPCVNACPVQALRKDELNGSTILDDKKCIGCGACAEACPFAAINMGPENAPLICDLCGGAPKCAEVCSVKAIEYEEFNKTVEKKRNEIVSADEKKLLKKWGIS